MEQDQLKEQYEILLQSLGYIELVVIASIMSYYALMLQRDHFEKIFAGQIPPTTPPVNTFPIDFAASGLLMGSLTYFYDLSNKQLTMPITDPQVREEAEINSLASSLVLMAGVLRLYNLVFQEMHIKESQQPLVEEELEEAAPF